MDPHEANRLDNAGRNGSLTAESVVLSWRFEPAPVIGLTVAALAYLRGWRRLHRQLPSRFPVERLASYLAGLGVVFFALASPLDAFAGWLLTVHMAQHLLLTMVAPPLILLGFPMLPLLTGLPRPFVRDGLGPFLTSPALHRFGRFLVHPFFAGPLFIVSNLAWHVPALYELALSSPGWHQLEHLCFLGTALLFWWPVVQPWPSRPALPRWAMIPYLLAADLQNTALSAFLSFCGRVVYPTYATAPRISGLSALDDQAGAGAFMWVSGSMAFLVPAGFIALRYLSPQRQGATHERSGRRVPIKAGGKFDLLLVPVIGRVMRLRYFRPVLQSIVFLLALAVLFDGLLGPQVSPMNLAGVLPWVHWGALTAIALLAVGNLFCMACPFTFARDLGRRIFPATRTWPRVLRSKWLAVAVLAGFFWSYEFFNLWSSPWWTAWIIIFYFAGAVLVDGIFKNASFCKYVCPIGQFNFIASLVSPMEVRVREAGVCATCKTHDCLRGNSSQRGCELELFQPAKSGNMDCTFCLDCVKACPHDNVGILAAAPGRDLIADPRRSSVGRFAQRPDMAALVLVFVFAAFVNAATMVTPVRDLQDGVIRVVGSHVAGTVWGIVFVFAVLVLPISIAWICGRLSALASGSDIRGITNGFSIALAPLGFAMWISHVASHIFSGILSPWPVAVRIFRDLGFGSAAPDWNIPTFAFEGLTGLQILLLDAGLLLCLWILWRKSRDTSGRAFPVFLPWACLATALYAAGIWLAFQPVDLRGTIVMP